MNIAKLLNDPWPWARRQLGKLTVGRQELARKTVKVDPTNNYRPTQFFSTDLLVNQLPRYTVFAGKLMMDSDPIVQFGLNVRNAALSVAEVQITAKSERVRQWVQSQWDTLWAMNGNKIRATKEWGFAGLQPIYRMNERTGLTEIETLKDFAPEDVRALESNGQQNGFRVRDRHLHGPFALWTTFNAKYGSPYGRGALRRMYPPWYVKWMGHGVENLLKQRMIKDAYIGDIFWYPENQMAELPDGSQVSFRDLFRQVGENRLSGGGLTLPRIVDDNGKELTGYTPPQSVSGATDIFQWADRTDENILRGADVPLEVVKAQENGGFSGRSIPFMVLLAVCNQEFIDYVQAIEEFLRIPAWLNFGGEPEFQIKPKSLVESFAKDAGGSPMGGGAIGGQPGQAPQQQPQPSPQRPPAQSMQFSESYDYSSTQFNLPGDVAFDVIQLAQLIHSDDLAGDGVELNPHITVKYGLHTDDPELVRSAVMPFSPVAVTFGKCSVFPANEATIQRGGAAHDVVKIEIESKSLHKLNATISESLACTDTYPNYKPHCTIAYVKPGLGEHYAAKLNALEGKAIVFDRLVFSDKQRNHTSIPLTGTARFDLSDEPATLIEEIAALGSRAARSRIRTAAQQIAALAQKKTAELGENHLRAILANELQASIAGVISNLQRGLSADLQASIFAANMAGAADVVVDVPVISPAQPPVAAVPPGVPPAPPPLIGSFFPDDPEPLVNFPVVDDAVAVLRNANVFTSTDYREVAEAARNGAFSITADLQVQQVEEIRDLLAKHLAEGPSLRGFIDEVEERLGAGGPMSEAHIEQVFRTNVHTAYSNGADRSLKHPMVSDAFPYRAYSATIDQRVRHTHIALEHLGLNSTNVYRADDPTWIKFRPPWEWQCRCAWYPVSVEMAARKGVQEAKDWWDRMTAMASERGGRPTEYQTITAPTVREWVQPPSFEPPAEFKRNA